MILSAIQMTLMGWVAVYVKEKKAKKTEVT
jgi:hypothetical protein